MNVPSVLQIVCCSVLIGLIGSPVFGEESKEGPFPDTLKLWGGYQYLFGLDAVVRLDGGATGFGTSFNLDDDLNMDTTDSMIRGGVQWRINQNHSIAFSYYKMEFDGKGTLDQNFQIDDIIFQANATTDSTFELALYRFQYNWSFYHSDKVELRLSPGFYVGDFEATFEANATIEPGDLPSASRRGEVKEDLFAPLPTVGLSVAYTIFPRLTATFQTDYFYVKIDDIEGSMAEVYIGLEYRVFDHFAIGTAFNRLWLDIDYKAGKSNGWEVDAKWNGVMGYGAIYF